MIRGTTAQFKFKLPYKKDELEWVTIKFWQPSSINEFLPITKTLEHCDTPEDSKELYVSLTAEETLRFSDKHKAKVQLRGLHKDGTVFGSRQHLITVYPIQDDLSGDITVPSNEDGWVILDGETISIQ